ncbi:uncharacterized protein LOC126273002 isoform X2 [Schistocerca gregaria]|uniref:uncharacterized protein LOC126273002 isoform X2 n=1 Tax=Schistocerca gregaria TaxID=7010 RepID=UPI00211DB43C|nr:uncharacterized protein LOC126273002 isoform X2 [Schistocerca gregaria]
MLEDGRLCAFSGTLLLVLLVLICLRPAGVACRMKCSAGGLCPGSYLCCHNQLCCLRSQRCQQPSTEVTCRRSDSDTIHRR